MAWRRYLPWLVGLLLAAAAVATFAALRSPPGKPAPRFDTMAVSAGPLQARVTTNGTLSALVTVQVGSQVSGRIQKIHVDFNSSVHEGQVIAEIDPLLFHAAVAQARANHAAARGNLAKAKAQAADAKLVFSRSDALFKEHLIAQAERDTAEANAKAAASQVDASRGVLEQARAALDHAEINLAYTRVVSPIDGVVISRNVDVGQTVAAAFQAPVLFLIAQDLRQMQVDTNVAEADVGRLSPGMETSFTVDAYPSDVFEGVIRQVRKNPQTVQNVVTYDAVIDVRNDELKLFPGMTANVTVIYADRERVVRVPNAALRFRPPAELTASRAGAQAPLGRKTVWVMREGERPEPIAVRVGVSDGTFTELLEGPLEPGDRLVTETLPTGKSGGVGFRVF